MFSLERLKSPASKIISPDRLDEQRTFLIPSEDRVFQIEKTCTPRGYIPCDRFIQPLPTGAIVEERKMANCCLRSLITLLHLSIAVAAGFVCIYSIIGWNSSVQCLPQLFNRDRTNIPYSTYAGYTHETINHKTGDVWLIKGPLSFIPSVNVKIIKQRKTIPLSKNEGVYIQDTHVGKVRLVMGPCSYMLTATEELWEKELSEEVEQLMSHGGGLGSGDIRKLAYYEQSIDPSILKGRDKTRVVTYRCPSNTAVQIYDYMKKTARVIFGPDLVVLGPHESFNVLRLSAGKPKKEGALKSLCLMLGPDFISDIIEVETSDHARLRLQLSFNNHFQVDKKDELSAKKIFSVPDFIGFACRQIGSRIRASVALTSFDSFHRYSAKIIHAAVFGRDSHGDNKEFLKFDVNNL
ncbi:hypothetical protein Btru_034666, partial [Bulinus truncatus]